MRGDHLAFLDARKAQIHFGGPLTDLAGAPETMLIVLRAESGNEAPAFMTDEPYNRSESCHALRFAQWLHIIAINAPFSVVSAIDKVID